MLTIILEIEKALGTGKKLKLSGVIRCVFGHEFLQYCLTYCGFEDIQSWDSAEEGFIKDSSFDQINGLSTSLNLKARLGRKGIAKYLLRRGR
jgi:hypothetical protein